MQLPLTLALQPSRAMLLLQGLAHGFAIFIAGWLALVSPYAWLLVVAIVASALTVAWRYRRPGVAGLHLGRDGRMEIESPDGRRAEATVLAQTLVLPGLIVLLLRRSGRVVALALPVDATGAGAHRQLRLWLKWQATPS